LYFHLKQKGIGFPFVNYLADTQIEIINSEIPRGKIRHALFDFDGTISLIREGWQDVMLPMFVEILRKETQTDETDEELAEVVREFVYRLTGKQTIYQMIQLREEIEKRGGQAKDPLEYKYEYLDRLWQRIHTRVDALKSGTQKPEEYLLPGTVELLNALKKHGADLYLASGTDLPYVRDECRALQVDHYFDPHIYGALDEYKKFSKRKIIHKILEENQLSGPELVAFGDGYVEIEDTKAVGGIAIGVASDEAGRIGIDMWKRERLIKAGADVIIPNYVEYDALIRYLFEDAP
jgi:phosphoglycolate phosphatase